MLRVAVVAVTQHGNDSLAPSLSLRLSLVVLLFLFASVSHSISIGLSISHTHTCVHSRAYTLAHIHTRTHIYTQSLAYRASLAAAAGSKSNIAELAMSAHANAARATHEAREKDETSYHGQAAVTGTTIMPGPPDKSMADRARALLLDMQRTGAGEGYRASLSRSPGGAAVGGAGGVGDGSGGSSTRRITALQRTRMDPEVSHTARHAHDTHAQRHAHSPLHAHDTHAHLVQAVVGEPAWCGERERWRSTARSEMEAGLVAKEQAVVRE